MKLLTDRELYSDAADPSTVGKLVSEILWLRSIREDLRRALSELSEILEKGKPVYPGPYAPHVMAVLARTQVEHDITR